MLIMFLSRKLNWSPAAVENLGLTICGAFLLGAMLGYWVAS